ncbi:MAG: helix-turn-helix domain-containing protein [Bryobacterales bacterium]|jgi:transposase|nr:helix-turn-helix domain-containing protein [Bryobacterales bacterium]
MNIKALHQAGPSMKQIARQSGYSRNTVRRVVRASAPAAFQTPERASCLDPHKAYLQERWQSTGKMRLTEASSVERFRFIRRM